MKDKLLLDKNSGLFQLISYVFVSGEAAVVEWIAFYIINSLLKISPIPATALAFIFSTFTNWVLGRTITFKEQVKDTFWLIDLIKVYGVSAVGLLWNLLLMYLFTGVLNWWPLGSKILATGIVFIWNFLIRKLWIYRKKNS